MRIPEQLQVGEIRQPSSSVRLETHAGWGREKGGSSTDSTTTY